MAVVTGPLLSLGASGTIAKTQTYSKWKGRPYVRQRVIPANPRSSDQVETRNVFSWLNSVWKVSPALFQAPWTAFASGKVLTNRNAFIKQDLPILRGLSTLTGMVMSPGAKGGLIGSLAVTPGSGTLAFTLTPPSVLPSGWSVLSATLALIKDQSPETGTDYEISAVTVAAPGAYTHTFTSLGATTKYWCAGWFVYQESSLATDLGYGPAIAADFTTT
jgi:hypothetical protein